MKKLVSMILALALCCAIAPSMADGDLTGEWYASFAGVPMTMTINADGTVTMSSPNKQGSASGTWKLEGDQLSITENGSTTTATVSNEGIKLSSGGMDMLFTREPVAAITVAEVKTDAAAADFQGEWSMTYLEANGVIVDPSAVNMALPNVKIGEGTIEFIPTSDKDMFAGIFNLLGLTCTYADGALTLTATTAGANAEGKVEMLTDGMIKVTLVNDGNPTILYYRSAKTAE